MSRNFYISDTHFGHKNILTYDKRPFFTIEEMEEEMVQIWNERVVDGDHVYILGDFAWTDNTKEWQRLLARLKGIKHLVRGNHDFPKHKDFPGYGADFIKAVMIGNTRDPLSNCLGGALESVHEYLEIEDTFGFETMRVIMSHYPMPCYRNGWNKNTVMLYGHVHTTIEYYNMLALQEKMWEQRFQHKYLEFNNPYSEAQFYNVGCMLDYMGYGPRTLEEIMKANLNRFD